ncbi:MAG: phosphodiester glycosidase family protein [Candidatus Aureabacteria bacterium]|nr:phosphodiester glycosidase family protein [Candidatus Auribacterota bacterium]
MNIFWLLHRLLILTLVLALWLEPGMIHASEWFGNPASTLAPQSLFADGKTIQSEPETHSLIKQIVKYSIIPVAGCAAIVFIYYFWGYSVMYKCLAAAAALMIIGTSAAILYWIKSIHSAIPLYAFLLYLLGLSVFDVVYLFFNRQLPHDADLIAYKMYHAFRPKRQQLVVSPSSFQSSFRQIGEGLDYSQVVVRRERSVKETGTLNLLRIGLEQNILFPVKSRVAPRGFLKSTLVLEDEFNHYQAVAAINGPYTSQSIPGWIVINGRELQGYNPNMELAADFVKRGYSEAVLWYTKKGTAHISRASDGLKKQLESQIQDIQFIIQNGPMIIENGSISPAIADNLEDSKKTAHSAVGIDSDGNVYFLNFDPRLGLPLSFDGISMLEFGRFMLAEAEKNGIRLVHVMSMDYASMSQLHVRKNQKYGFKGFSRNGGVETNVSLLVLPRTAPVKETRKRPSEWYDDPAPFGKWFKAQGQYPPPQIIRNNTNRTSRFRFDFKETNIRVVQMRPLLPPGAHVKGISFKLHSTLPLKNIRMGFTGPYGTFPGHVRAKEYYDPATAVVYFPTTVLPFNQDSVDMKRFDLIFNDDGIRNPGRDFSVTISDLKFDKGYPVWDGKIIYSPAINRSS